METGEYAALEALPWWSMGKVPFAWLSLSMILRGAKHVRRYALFFPAMHTTVSHTPLPPLKLAQTFIFTLFVSLV